MALYRKSGDNTRWTIPAGFGTVVKGNGVLSPDGRIFGVAASGGAEGATIDLLLTGEVDLEKDGEAYGQGELVPWDATNKRVAKRGSRYVACVLADAAAGDALVRCVLIPSIDAGGTQRAMTVFDPGAVAALRTIGAHFVGPEIPKGARITRAFYIVTTTFTSAADTATIGLGFDTDDADGIVAAIAINNGGNPWDAGNHEGIQDGAAANFGEALTADRQIEVNVAVQAITAGRLALFLDYVNP